ncbi:hypothetical protein PsYK624_171670, partial [Phanerochaete sordida]
MVTTFAATWPRHQLRPDDEARAGRRGEWARGACAFQRRVQCDGPHEAADDAASVASTIVGDRRKALLCPFVLFFSSAQLERQLSERGCCPQANGTFMNRSERDPEIRHAATTVASTLGALGGGTSCGRSDDLSRRKIFANLWVLSEVVEWSAFAAGISNELKEIRGLPEAASAEDIAPPLLAAGSLFMCAVCDVAPRVEGVNKLKATRGSPGADKAEGASASLSAVGSLFMCAVCDVAPRVEGVNKLKATRGSPRADKAEGASASLSAVGSLFMCAVCDVAPRVEGVNKLKATRGS